MAVVLAGLWETFLSSPSLAQTNQNNRFTESQQWQRRDRSDLNYSDLSASHHRSIPSSSLQGTERLKWKSPGRTAPFKTKDPDVTGKQQQQEANRGTYTWVTPAHRKAKTVVPAEHSSSTRFAGPFRDRGLRNGERLARNPIDDDLDLLEQLEADKKDDILDLLEADETDDDLDLLDQLEADPTNEPAIDLNELEDDLNLLEQKGLKDDETRKVPERLDDDQQPEFPLELLESPEQELTIPTETSGADGDQFDGDQFDSENEWDDQDVNESEILQDFPTAEDFTSSIFGGRGDHEDNSDACARHAANCQKYWERVGVHGITTISIDVTPPYAPDPLDAKNNNAMERDRLEKLAHSGYRVWKDRDGNVLTEGQFIDYGNGQVRIQTASESVESIRYSNLSDEDACYVADWWGIPNECRLSSSLSEGRRWESLTTTWKASALCHKPLYFEQMAVERYGHSFGPVAQPIVSAAHFFGHVATLPYHVGINPPNECRYALGCYRPGNCAPYLFPPLPLSLRGAASQAGAVLGLVYFIP